MLALVSMASSGGMWTKLAVLVSALRNTAPIQEATVNNLAKNMVLTALSQDKLDWCVFQTLG